MLTVSAVALAGAAWAWWDRRRQDPWLRLQQRVLQRLQACGVPVRPHHPPRERAAQVRAALGPAGGAAAALLDDLDRRRYADPAAPMPYRPWWRAFRAALRGVRDMRV